MSTRKIRLVNLQDKYYAGDKITGMVICSVDRSQDIEEIQVNLVGAEHTSLVEPEVGKEDPVEYSGNNIFLELEKRWLGQGDLTPGEHEYPFELQLPKSLPGTYQSKCGWIKYTITLKIDNIIVYTKTVRILAPINFNEIRGLSLKPVSLSEEKAVCSWFLCNGFLSINVNLDKEAFVLGEVVKVSVQITNNGDFDTFRIDAKIWMIVESTVVSPQRRTDRVTVLLTGYSSDASVQIGRQRKYIFDLELPKFAKVPNFTLSKLFSQKCVLEVTGFQACCSDIKLATNIIVGHIPIYNIPIIVKREHRNQEVTVRPRDNPLPWLRLPTQDETPSSATPLSALDKSKGPPPIGYNQAPSWSDIPRPPSLTNPLPYLPDIPQPAGSSSYPYPPQPSAPPIKTENKEALDEVKPVDSYSLRQPAPYPPKDLKSPDSHLPQTHRAPYPSHEGPTRDLNVVSWEEHTSIPYPPENINAPIPSHDIPVPYLPNFAKLEPVRSDRSYPVDDNSAPYPPAKSDRPYPVGDNCAPYPPKSPKYRRSYLPQTHIASSYEERKTEQNVVSSEGHTPTPYPPAKPYPDSGNHAPYPPEDSEPPSSHPPRAETTPYPSYEGHTYAIHSLEETNDISIPYLDMSIPYLPSSPKHSHQSDKHEPPYPYSHDQHTTEPGLSRTETQKLILLAVGKPKPYRSYFNSGSSAKYPPESSRLTYPPGNNSPYTSAMPQPERSNPPYPTSVPSFNKLSTPYPPSNSPLAMPKPDYLYEYRSHTAPYPQDTPKPPYSSGFKPSFSSGRYEVPYPLDEAKHAHPINKKPQPPYPLEAKHPHPIKDKPQPPYPLDEAKHPHPINKPQPPYPLNEAKHPHPINNESQPPYPASSPVATHSYERHRTSPPSARNVAPYPIDTGPSTSTNLSPLVFPLPSKKLPPRCDSIGFAVPTASTTESSSEYHDAVPFVPLVPLPISVPYRPTHAPNAPPNGNDASDHDLAEAGPATPLLEGGLELTPPPSYEEAISSPIRTPPKRK